MAMNWTSLSGAKGVAGALATWVNYSKLDVPTIIDEAQALLYGLLRVREMRAEYAFTLTANAANIALPARFLDPIGRIHLPSINTSVRHKDMGFIQEARTYTETSGTLGNNPYTTTSASNTVTVNLTGNGFSQDSVFYSSGATLFNGVSINGTFPVTSIVDANNFTIDISVLGTTPSDSGSGGGSAVGYVCDNLNTGIPAWFGIWNETIYFDMALYQQVSGKLQYFQSLPLLSASNQTNFLTNRYPHLMRRACVAAAADFMKDTEEYNKDLQALTALVGAVNVENDGVMRGMELDAENP